MIKLNTAKLHDIILPNSNKALAEVLKDVTPQKLAQLTQTKDLTSLLEGLFKGNIADDMQNETLIELLKNNPTLKSLGNIKTTMQELLGVLKQQGTASELQKSLESMLQNIKDIDPKTLQQKLQNSGIFLESKLKHASDATLKDILSNDFKALVLKTQADTPLPQLEKLALQLDYYQLLSHLGNNSALFLPYNFEMLDEGNLTIKKAQQNSFFCDIELTLKKFGSLYVRVGLFEEQYLNINLQTQSEQLKKDLLPHLQELRENLQKAGIIVKGIRFLDNNKRNLYDTPLQDIDLGFEAKV
ncbi:MAG: flagellar hook-length control protein FliK [Epsilonproteobacteria bacterium]|nr:flagellar hook-length control protein FliK [Campylobacterota bacterium]